MPPEVEGLDAAEFVQASPVVLQVGAVDGDVLIVARSDEELWVVPR